MMQSLSREGANPPDSFHKEESLVEKNGSSTGSVEQIFVAVTGRTAALALKFCSAPDRRTAKRRHKV